MPAQHTHVVGAGALDVALAVLHAAPEVAAADDDAHLYAGLHALLKKEKFSIYPLCKTEKIRYNVAVKI